MGGDEYEVWQKDISKREMEGLQSKTCYDGLLGDGGTDKKQEIELEVAELKDSPIFIEIDQNEQDYKWVYQRDLKSNAFETN